MLTERGAVASKFREEFDAASLDLPSMGGAVREILRRRRFAGDDGILLGAGWI